MYHTIKGFWKELIYCIILAHNSLILTTERQVENGTHFAITAGVGFIKTLAIIISSINDIGKNIEWATNHSFIYASICTLCVKTLSHIKPAAASFHSFPQYYVALFIIVLCCSVSRICLWSCNLVYLPWLILRIYCNVTVDGFCLHYHDCVKCEVFLGSGKLLYIYLFIIIVLQPSCAVIVPETLHILCSWCR